MVESRVWQRGDKERDANKNATLRAIVDKINKSFRLPGHIWNFIHVLWLPVDAQLCSAASALSFCCLFREILVCFFSDFFLLVLLPVYCWVNILVIFINFLSLLGSLLLCFGCIFIQLVQLQEFPWLATRATPFFRHSLHALRESLWLKDISKKGG